MQRRRRGYHFTHAGVEEWGLISPAPATKLISQQDERPIKWKGRKHSTVTKILVSHYQQDRSVCFPGCGLSLAVSQVLLAAELGVLGGDCWGPATKAVLHLGANLAWEWLQGAGCVHRFAKDATPVHITRAFPCSGCCIEAIRHQAKEKPPTALGRLCSPASDSSMRYPTHGGVMERLVSQGSPPVWRWRWL